jgi:hypothetical protein
LWITFQQHYFDVKVPRWYDFNDLERGSLIK